MKRDRESSNDEYQVLKMKTNLKKQFILRPLPLTQEESPRKRRKRQEMKRKCLTLMGEMVIPKNPTKAMQHVYISTVRLCRINMLAKGDLYLRYFTETLQRTYRPLLLHILHKILFATKAIEKRRKIVLHFRDLVLFLQGRGREITPRSVYFAKERLCRLLSWYYKRQALAARKKKKKLESSKCESKYESKTFSE
jgi:hypothetical protein